MENRTLAAQNVARLSATAIRIKPRTQEPTIRRKASARPQTSSILAIGMYTAPAIELDTMVMTVSKEWELHWLVTYGVKLARMASLKPFVKKRSQMLLVC